MNDLKLAYSRLMEAVRAGKTHRFGWERDGKECMMAAMVPYATSVDDCTEAGWPPWLTYLLIWLYQENVDASGATGEQRAADNWATEVANHVSLLASRASAWGLKPDFDAVRWRWLRMAWGRAATIDETGRLARAVDLIAEERYEALLDMAEGGETMWQLALYNLGTSGAPFDALTAGTAVMNAWDFAFEHAWWGGGLDEHNKLEDARAATCQAAARAVVELRTRPQEFPEYLHLQHARGEPALMAAYRGFNCAVEATVELTRDPETKWAVRQAIGDSRTVSARILREYVVKAFRECRN